ncbi:hypothetical protein BTE54_23760 [Agrobacterium sp. YIC 4121]|nr:hypothetical protein BTE54_23760 [Agrobacterium sp. YIC 4121]
MVRLKQDKSSTMTTSDAAKYLGKSKSWLDKTRLNGSGPVYHKIGGNVRYMVADLDVWMERSRRTAVYDFANAVPS